MLLDIDISGLIPKHMENRGKLTLKENLKIIENILEQRKVPERGISEEHIKFLLRILSFMDTDKDPNVIQIGEREARVYTKLQRESVFDFCHGVGRSGNLIDPQPKAPGASVMYKLTNKLLENFLKSLGLNVKAIATPVATGMSISLSLSASRKKYNSNVVIYPYAAHKSPIKATSFIGMRMRLVETVLDGDSVKVEVSDIEDAVRKEIKNKNNPVVLSTLTFFPPRESDDIEEIAKICQDYNIPHIINGAYAIQNFYYIDKIKKALRYRVDAIISSSDKNLFTPIGGGIVYTKDESFLKEISLTYPGRASANPIVNILISLLAIGTKNYIDLMKEQKECKKLLDELLNDLANKKGEMVLNVKNPISSCITTKKDPLNVAGKLYNLRVTGPRGVRKNDKFGTCYLGEYPYDYIVVNSAIGVKKEDIYNVIEKLSKVI
ncbi:O-phosphoseryl-tRNA(Sec) selenium transferase [Methanocaldococcus sp.]